MINRFEEAIALKSLDQMKYYVAVFVSDLENLATFRKLEQLCFVGYIKSEFRIPAII